MKIEQQQRTILCDFCQKTCDSSHISSKTKRGTEVHICSNCFRKIVNKEKVN